MASRFTIQEQIVFFLLFMSMLFAIAQFIDSQYSIFLIMLLIVALMWVIDFSEKGDDEVADAN